MTDDLKRRLRQADPARSTGVRQFFDTSMQDLMEATMQNTTTRTIPPLSRWLPAAAAAVLVLGGLAGAAILVDDDPSRPPGGGAAMELALPASDVMSSCIQYSVAVLAQMPTAFSGKVLEADDDSVVLQVDRWYRGGSAGTVELVNQGGETTSIDGVEFTEGNRYLVTASTEGTVNTCGYTAEWSPQMASDFEDAFGR